MRFVTRGLALLGVLTGLAGAPAEAQQQKGVSDQFRVYLGGQGGVLGFRTDLQTRGWEPSVGGHVMVTAKRTALIVAYDQTLNAAQSASYQALNLPATTVPTYATIPTTFTNLKRYSFSLVGFPVRSPLEPYFGVGLTLRSAGGVLTAGSTDQFAESVLSAAHLHFLGGLQIRVGGVNLFGEVRYLTSGGTQRVEQPVVPGAPVIGVRPALAIGRPLDGPLYQLNAGLRISLGGAREQLTSRN